jgi:signal transduction protein with GAF and PtsI domain
VRLTSILTVCMYMALLICNQQGKGLAGAVALDGKPLNIIDAYDDPRFNRYIQLYLYIYTINSAVVAIAMLYQ